MCLYTFCHHGLSFQASSTTGGKQWLSVDQSIRGEGRCEWHIKCLLLCWVLHPYPRSCGTSVRKVVFNLKIIRSQSSPKYPTSFSLHMLFKAALLKCTLLPHVTCISSNEKNPCKSPAQLTMTAPGWQANLIHLESFSVRWLYSSVKFKLINLNKKTPKQH